MAQFNTQKNNSALDYGIAIVPSFISLCFLALPFFIKHNLIISNILSIYFVVIPIVILIQILSVFFTLTKKPKNSLNLSIIIFDVIVILLNLFIYTHAIIH